MRLCSGALVAAGACALAGSAFVSPEEGAPPIQSATLTYQAVPDWSFILPREQWFSAAEHVGVPHAGDAAGFLAEQTGVMALEVDTDGDGELDAKIKGAAGFAKLRAKSAEGAQVDYAVRVKFDGGYKWTPSGVMTGKLLGQVVRVIDQDGNGRYDDYGSDALVVGAGTAASYLSKVVNIDGALHNLTISADGARIDTTPYTGECGTLDLASKFASRGELLSAVVKNGELSFNLAAARSGMLVPVGKYEFSVGFVKKAGETAWIKRGRSSPLVVEAAALTALEWGGPVFAEFDYSKQGDTVVVSPNVAFYGQAGEEYGPFAPEAKSPKILVTDKKTGKLVASGRFGGC
jgi:hypothetical protein